MPTPLDNPVITQRGLDILRKSFGTLSNADQAHRYFEQEFLRGAEPKLVLGNGLSLEEAMKPLPYDVDGKTAKLLDALERALDLMRMERTRPGKGRS